MSQSPIAVSKAFSQWAHVIRHQFTRVGLLGPGVPMTASELGEALMEFTNQNRMDGDADQLLVECLKIINNRRSRAVLRRIENRSLVDANESNSTRMRFKFSTNPEFKAWVDAIRDSLNPRMPVPISYRELADALMFFVELHRCPESGDSFGSICERLVAEFPMRLDKRRQMRILHFIENKGVEK